MRRVELSDMQFGQIEGELRMMRSACNVKAGLIATMTPERKALRDRAEYLSGLIEALNAAEPFDPGNSFAENHDRLGHPNGVVY